MSTAAVFAASFGSLYAAHTFADHWVQTDHQANTKAGTSARAYVACAGHVASYTATCVAGLVAMAWVCGIALSLPMVAIAMVFNALTHYVADKRTPLAWLAKITGHANFYRLGSPRPGRDDNPSLGTGAYQLDQSFHIAMLFITALIIAGGAA